MRCPAPGAARPAQRCADPPLGSTAAWPAAEATERQAHRGGRGHTAAVRASGRAAARPARPLGPAAPGRCLQTMASKRARTAGNTDVVLTAGHPAINAELRRADRPAPSASPARLGAVFKAWGPAEHARLEPFSQPVPSPERRRRAICFVTHLAHTASMGLHSRRVSGPSTASWLGPRL